MRKVNDAIINPDELKSNWRQSPLIARPISWTDLKRVIAYLSPTYARDEKGEPDLNRPLRMMRVTVKHEPGRGYWMGEIKILSDQLPTGPQQAEMDMCLLTILSPGVLRNSDYPNVRTWIVNQKGDERRYGKLESMITDLRRLCGDTPVVIDLRIPPDGMEIPPWRSPLGIPRDEMS